MSWSSVSCEPGCPNCSRLRRAAVALVGGASLEVLGDRALAAAAGLEVTEAQRHYRSAVACLLAAYDELTNELIVAYDEAFATASSWQDGLRAGNAGLLARLARRPAEARLLFVEILRGDERLRRRRDEARRRSAALLAAEHQRRRGLEDLPEIHFELLQGAMFQMIAAEVVAGRTGDVEHLAPDLLTLLEVFEPIAA
jgi:hypothetical protein